MFSVIIRTLIQGEVLPLCRGAVSVFYSPSWLGNVGFSRDCVNSHYNKIKTGLSIGFYFRVLRICNLQYTVGEQRYFMKTMKLIQCERFKLEYNIIIIFLEFDVCCSAHENVSSDTIRKLVINSIFFKKEKRKLIFIIFTYKIYHHLIAGYCWLVGFYGISTFVGYLMPNPFLCK